MSAKVRRVRSAKRRRPVIAAGSHLHGDSWSSRYSTTDTDERERKREKEQTERMTDRVDRQC